MLSKTINIEEVASSILDAGVVEIRDVDNGELPFVYTIGNRVPGYVMIKEGVVYWTAEN